MTIGSGIRPTHRGPDHRHGSRCPALDGAWVARRDADGRGQSGGGGPHGAGTPAGDPEAAATRRKLAALLRLALALLHTSGFRLSAARLPDGQPSCGSCAPWIGRASVSRCERSSGSCSVAESVSAWRRRHTCALDDQSSCPPHVTASTDALRDPGDRTMVTSPDYRHVPTGTLAVLAQRLGTCPRRRRPGIASSGDGWRRPGSACIQRSRRWGYARRELTRCGTSTPPSSACSTGHAPICTP